MKALYHIAICFAASLLLLSCISEDQYDNNPKGNLEALWKIMDKHYCFFPEKAELYGLDWDEVHTRYAAQVDANMTENQLFEVLGNMLSELRDGHVNLYSPWDVARNWSWHEDYPSNIADTLISKYLGSGNITEILSYLILCDGIIIDIRDNSGGLLTSAEQLAAHFTDDEVLVGYMKHKIGTAHDAFSGMKEQRIKPSKGLRWHKPVAILTNRQVFSAANEFVKYMRCMPNVVTVGDSTGGGGGLPFSDELPIGWSVRFSACPMFDKDKNSVENGIAPDYNVSLSQSDLTRGYDSIIETARTLIHNME